jgi:hypothetical protein
MVDCRLEFDPDALMCTSMFDLSAEDISGCFLLVRFRGFTVASGSADDPPALPLDRNCTTISRFCFCVVLSRVPNAPR